MLKNTDSDFSALLPDSLRGDAGIKRLEAGFADGYRNLVRDLPAVLPWENLAEQTEPVLSLMAYEASPLLWVPDWTDRVKREVLGGSLRWRMIHGTPLCVEEFAAVVLEATAYVLPWWLYGGEPGRFRVRVPFAGHGYTEKNILDALAAIMRAKNTRSHLDSLSLEIACSGKVFCGAACITGQRITVYPWRVPGVTLKSSAPVTGAAVQTVQRLTAWPRADNLDAGPAYPAQVAIVDGNERVRR